MRTSTTRRTMGVGGITDAVRERGSAVVSFVVLAPVMLFMVLGVVQVAIIGHVRHVATLAATAGVAEAAAIDGSQAAGQARAQAQLSGASGWVVNPVVSASRSTTQATIVVRASAYQVIPFGDWGVVVERTSPVERPQE